MREIKLFVVTHKKDNLNYPDRTYIHVGNGECPPNMISDSFGDNISEKNKSFCELTAIYWIWKNVECDVVGIEHYRRVFGFSFFNMKNYFILKPKKIDKILNKSDVICINKTKFRYTFINRYRKNVDPNDLDYIRKIISEKYPDYLDAYDKVVNSNSTAMCNMMISSKKLFNSYCEWLFDILFEAEQYIDVSNRDVYRTRCFGLISEPLLNVWLLKNNLKVYYTPVIRSDKGRLRALLRLIKSKLSYLFRKEVHLDNNSQK